ncbi:MAG: GNAT family N-acetyltransferase [Lentisphaerae bacterium]|nr:GNAT family N-acetyltransferase [Lentisphaerota bacterium]
MKRLSRKADPTRTSKIVLGQDPEVDALYGCFRLNNPRGDAFAPEREVEIVARSGKKNQVSVPAALRVDLPADQKVVNTEVFHLEEIGREHATMHLLTMRAGWNQTFVDIRRMVGLDKHGSFVARLKGTDFNIPVATSSVLPLGRNNTWIGMILVHPEARRQGIANAMMQACTRYALEQGKVINGLDATPMGNTVYGAVGYVNSYRLWRSVFELAEFAGKSYDRQHVLAIQAADLPEVIRYDAAAFLERGNVLSKMFADSPAGCFIYRNDAGVIQGHCFSRPGRIRAFVGPFIADTEEIARHLLTAASQKLLEDPANQTAFLDTPESKFADQGVYVERVFDQEKKPSGHRLSATLKPVRDFTRMYQLVHYTEVDALVNRFMQAEGLRKDSTRVADFSATMSLAVANYTETLAFMTLERQSLQQKFWGITGPEKG